MIKILKSKLGKLYWDLIKQMNKIWYVTKKYIHSLFVWLCGIGRIKGSFDEAAAAQTLIICAHPDDETIFFSSVIKKERPFILCMSHSGNTVRRSEFQNALNTQNALGGIMLNFPDVPGMKWVWKYRMSFRLKRIKKRFPNVKKIYTHSRYGESGHPHHFCVHDGVVSAFDNCKIYVTAAEFRAELGGLLDEAAVEKKMHIIRDIYSTQVNMLVRWCEWFDDYLYYELFEEEK